MDDRIDRVVGKYAAQGVRITNIAANKARRPSADHRHPAQRLLPGIAEIVEDDNLHSGSEQFDAGVRTNEAGAAGDENFHRKDYGRPREV